LAHPHAVKQATLGWCSKHGARQHIVAPPDVQRHEDLARNPQLGRQRDVVKAPTVVSRKAAT